MGVLDQVMQMRNQGLSDQDIVSSLQEQGASPKVITDALNQANIKSAVGNGGYVGTGSDGIPSPGGQSYYDNPNPEQQSGAVDDYYTPSPQQPPAQGGGYPSSQSFQEFYPQQEQGSYTPGPDTDTIIEVSQQVLNEGLKKIKQELENLSEFKTLYQAKTDGMYERLKRIEATIDRLQMSILDKVGSYGAGIENVKKEMEMMQDSFAKIAGSVAERHHSQPTHSQSQTPSQPSHTSSRNKENGSHKTHITHSAKTRKRR